MGNKCLFFIHDFTHPNSRKRVGYHRRSLSNSMWDNHKTHDYLLMEKIQAPTPLLNTDEAIMGRINFSAKEDSLGKKVGEIMCRYQNSKCWNTWLWPSLQMHIESILTGMLISEKEIHSIIWIQTLKKNPPPMWLYYFTTGEEKDIWRLIWTYTRLYAETSRSHDTAKMNRDFHPHLKQF